jgi:hypothetical protein
MTAARRLAAILAANVVGYSRLMGEDEADGAVGRRAARGGVAAPEARLKPGRRSFSRRRPCRHPLPCLLRASAAPCR